MKTTTFYEFPLNERIRVFMRLEQLFLQLSHCMEGSNTFDKRAALSTLLNIFMIFSRNDIKSELLKELERHTTFLKQLISRQAADTDKIQEITDNLSQISQNLYKINGKIGSKVMGSDLFQSISQRNAIPGGACSFDLPAYHYWLEQDKKLQQADLTLWTEPFKDIRAAIYLILDLIRQSGIERPQVAKEGFFQLSLDKKMQPFQLLRISVDAQLPYFAEISGGKHRFTIRFMSPAIDNNRPIQTIDDITFLLSNCVF